MALKALKRKYNFSDGDLSELSDSLLGFANRDSAEMAGYGYDAAKIAAIQALRDAFVAIPTDEYYSGEMMIATADKNTKFDVATNTAEGIVQRAVIRWNQGDPHVSQFGWAGYAAKKENDKLPVLRLVHKTGTDRLGDLGAQGLTQQILDDFQVEIDAVDQAITTKKTKVSERDIATQGRIKAGNDLYEALVKLADTGKLIWEDTDEAKYNDYVIYSSQAAGAEVVTGNPAPASNHEPSVNINAGTEQLDFKNTGTVDLEIYFSDDIANPPNGPVEMVMPGQQWQGPASDIGWADTHKRFLVKNNDPMTAGAFELVVT